MAGSSTAANRTAWSELADDDELPTTNPKWDSNAARLVIWRHTAVERGEAVAVAVEVFKDNVGDAADQGKDAGYAKMVCASPGC